MEVQISQDIRKFKTKDIGNFSFKEAGFIVLAGAVGIITYNLFDKNLEIAIIPSALILAFGFIKPFGMSMITFLRTVVKEAISPAVYINETNFEYDMEYLKKKFGKNYTVITDDFIQNDSDNNIRNTNYEEDLIMR